MAERPPTPPSPDQLLPEAVKTFAGLRSGQRGASANPGIAHRRPARRAVRAGGGAGAAAAVGPAGRPPGSRRTGRDEAGASLARAARPVAESMAFVERSGRRGAGSRGVRRPGAGPRGRRGGRPLEISTSLAQFERAGRRRRPGEGGERDGGGWEKRPGKPEMRSGMGAQDEAGGGQEVCSRIAVLSPAHLSLAPLPPPPSVASTAGSPAPPPPPPSDDVILPPGREPLRDITRYFQHVSRSPSGSSGEEEEGEGERRGGARPPPSPVPLSSLPFRSSFPGQAARRRALGLSSAAIRRKRHSWCIR